MLVTTVEGRGLTSCIKTKDKAVEASLTNKSKLKALNSITNDDHTTQLRMHVAPLEEAKPAALA
ncbi:hypothetical protein N7490_003213 [Penicillium lividum]|nr:hypothetical protein N7490_003213 [Penicillium lividum]